MKGFITNIKRMAVHDGDGLRTTVFMKGCPLKCVWCHNPEGLSFEKEVGYFAHKCIACGICHEMCKGGAIDENLKRDPGKCVNCFQCVEACPVGGRVAYGEEWDVDMLVEKLLQDRPFFEISGGGVTFSGGECLCQIDFVEEAARLSHAEGISVDIDTCGYVSEDMPIDKWVYIL